MKRSKNLLGCLVIAASVIAGCGTAAHIEKDKSADLSKYKTYTWLPKEDQKSMNHRYDIAESNIRNSVDEQMEKNGYTKVKGNADLLLTYDLLVEKTTRNESDPLYSQPYSRLYYNPYTGRYRNIYFPSQFIGYENSTTPVKEGTVTISMVDPKTDKTIWQGWTTEELDGSRLTSKEIEKNVKTIFKKFDIQRR